AIKLRAPSLGGFEVADPKASKTCKYRRVIINPMASRASEFFGDQNMLRKTSLRNRTINSPNSRVYSSRACRSGRERKKDGVHLVRRVPGVMSRLMSSE